MALLSSVILCQTQKENKQLSTSVKNCFLIPFFCISISLFFFLCVFLSSLSSFRRKGKQKRETRRNKRIFFQLLSLAHTRKYAKPFFLEKIPFFPTGERISYFFSKEKEYHIFSPKSNRSEKYPKLFLGEIFHFLIFCPQEKEYHVFFPEGKNIFSPQQCFPL